MPNHNATGMMAAQQLANLANLSASLNRSHRADADNTADHQQQQQQQQQQQHQQMLQQAHLMQLSGLIPCKRVQSRLSPCIALLFPLTSAPSCFLFTRADLARRTTFGGSIFEQG
jgi:hypothetical protein